MHMLFDFLVNQHLFLALARKDKTPMVQAMHLPPPIPDNGQWAHFLRNHDELDLGRLTDGQREAVYDAFAPEEGVRLYGRGIRRRLAPMLDGDPDRLRLVHSLLFTLPGTPVLRYGEEIDMGEDLSLPERNAVRATMQWSDDHDGGFSPAPPEMLPRPAIRDGEYGYETLSVEAQAGDPDSLLEWMKRAVRVRKACPELAHGEAVLLETDQPDVFAHACVLDGSAVAAIHNLADEERTVTVDVSGLDGDRAMAVLDERQAIEIEKGRVTLKLVRYGRR